MNRTGPSRVALTRWLIGHTRRLLPMLGVSVLARIAGQLAAVALFVLAADAIFRAAAGTGVPMARLVALLTGIALVKALLRYLEHYAGHWVAFTALQRLRELFFARLAPHAPAATTGRAGAELTDRATRDIDRIEVFFAHTLPPAVSAVVVPAIAVAWLATASTPLALTVAAFTFAVLLVPLAAGNATWRSARDVAEDRGAVVAQIGDDVQGVRDVLAFDAGRRRLERLDEIDRALSRTRSGAGAVQGARAAAITALQAGSLVAVVGIGSITGASVPTVILALAVGIGLWAPARGIDDFVAGLDASFAAAARVREVTEADPLISEPSSPVAPGAGSGAEFAQVTFRYPGTTRAALDDVSLRVEPGSWTRVVGVSGGGKSTLAALLLRGWDPDGGIVRLAGKDVATISLEVLRSRIALVPQHPALLSGSLADNLRLACPDADETLLRAALHTAGLDEWVRDLPDGLGTSLGRRARGVSGGQLARIAIARALVAQPELLILDEALSQLDAGTAAQVTRNLATWRPGLTILEITHRADLVPADAPVVVLDGGRVLAQGTAGQLRATGGAFTRLEARG